MMDIGRVCVKLAGRDSGKKCVIISVVDANTVMIDGATRRRKCNVKHLEPLAQVLEIAENASSKDICAALEIPVKDAKAKQKAVRPARVRKGKSQNASEAVKESAPVKKSAKKAPKVETSE